MRLCLQPLPAAVTDMNMSTQDITDSKPEDQKDHAPDLMPASPQKSATTHNAADSNAAHKAALERFHGLVQERLAPPAAPPDIQLPSADAPPRTVSPCSCVATAPSLHAEAPPEPLPAHASTLPSGPIQSPPVAQILTQLPSHQARNAGPMTPQQTKAGGIPNSSSHPAEEPPSAN